MDRRILTLLDHLGLPLVVVAAGEFVTGGGQGGDRQHQITLESTGSASTR
jgi:hypothetical protein